MKDEKILAAFYGRRSLVSLDSGIDSRRCSLVGKHCGKLEKAGKKFRKQQLAKENAAMHHHHHHTTTNGQNGHFLDGAVYVEGNLEPGVVYEWSEDDEFQKEKATRVLLCSSLTSFVLFMSALITCLLVTADSSPNGKDPIFGDEPKPSVARSHQSRLLHAVSGIALFTLIFALILRICSLIARLRNSRFVWRMAEKSPKVLFLVCLPIVPLIAFGFAVMILGYMYLSIWLLSFTEVTAEK